MKALKNIFFVLIGLGVIAYMVNYLTQNPPSDGLGESNTTTEINESLSNLGQSVGKISKAISFDPHMIHSVVHGDVQTEQGLATMYFTSQECPVQKDLWHKAVLVFSGVPSDSLYCWMLIDQSSAMVFKDDPKNIKEIDISGFITDPPQL